MVVKHKSLPRVIMTLLLLVTFHCSAADGSTKTVFVTGSLVNNTKYSWSPNFLLLFPNGSSGDIRMNIAPFEAPSKGVFMIPIKVGESTQVTLNTSGALPFNVNICTFNIKADSQTHATMQLISTNNSTPVSCQYLGDPNKNTAEIVITNNT